MTSPHTSATDRFRQPPDDYIEIVPGTSAAYRRFGSGPDVLFVHGWPVSGATFRHLIGYLGDDLTCHVIDLPGAGDSIFDNYSPLGLNLHIATVRRCLEVLDLDSVATVGFDSGGLIARHALAGDERVRSFGLIDTEPPGSPGWRVRAFLAARHLPGFATMFRAAIANTTIRRHPLVLGGAFVDSSLLDGEFDELFLRPLRDSHRHLDGAVRILRSFDTQLVRQLDELHRRIDVPVQLVWGKHDPFFPIEHAAQMARTFANAQLATIADAALFSHEERPAEVAAALLPTLRAD